jgi:Uma2 family endonuclease
VRPEVLRRKDYTAEEAYWLNPPGRWELLHGEIVYMSPAGFRHGQVVTRVAKLLDDFVASRRLGAVVSGDPGFVLKRSPDTVRAPDVAFLRAERVPSPAPVEFFEGAPDLAIEVLSPGDRWPDVERKASEFLAAGSSAVWAVDPETRTARVYLTGHIRVIASEGALDHPDLLPGFILPLRELFA